MTGNSLKISLRQFDRPFWVSLLGLALPISFQQMLTASFNLVDIGMIGQLGSNELAAVGLISKLFFVSMHLIGGLAGGVGVMVAQYSGKGNKSGEKSILALALLVASVLTLPLTLISWFAPSFVMRQLTDQVLLQAMGAEYLKITAPVHWLTSIILVIASVMRSTKRSKIPLFAAICGILLNSLLNYLFIFGYGFLPALGIKGAAYATVIARVVELIWLCSTAYALSLPFSFSSWKDFASHLSWNEFKRLFQTTFPIILGEVSWSVGVMMYYIIYGYIGVEALAAMSLLEPIEGIFIQFFIGFGSACGIMLGNDLGADRPEKAFSKGILFLMIIPFSGMLAGLGLMLLHTPVFMFFNHLGAEVLALVGDILIIMGATLFIKLFNMTSMMGVLRSGGDTKYAFLIDLGSMWGVGVPLAFLGGVVFGLNLQWVYVLILIEELVKLVWSMSRIKSKRWLNNLVS